MAFVSYDFYGRTGDNLVVGLFLPQVLVVAEFARIGIVGERHDTRL